MRCFLGNIRAGLLVPLVTIASFGCDETSKSPSNSGSERSQNSVPEGSQKEATPSPSLSPPVEQRVPTAVCPKGMVKIPGGEFWVGTLREVYDREENPQFKAKIGSFCIDRLEVATSEYEKCVSDGKCSESQRVSVTCNSVEKGKGDHPVNCIDHTQARSVCAARSARLPTEIEWEYVARGGAEMREFPWGAAQPDDHTCWKQPGTCKRGSYPEEAFGLHDVVGNVWEWTDSWFGPYPWPAQEGRHKVYRGGGWSRRFAKWMRPNLRNRQDPKDSGSHLGARCARTLPSEKCDGKPTEAGGCQHQILEVKCLDEHKWNGVRCAEPGDDRKCLPPSVEEPGYGCVQPRVSGSVKKSLDLTGVTRSRSPEFDADCLTNKPGRPLAYRYSGGGHLERNVVGKEHGCKNRDVGVGFNSACCPN